VKRKNGRFGSRSAAAPCGSSFGARDFRRRFDSGARAGRPSGLSELMGRYLNYSRWVKILSTLWPDLLRQLIYRRLAG
jgi:hypothetical protein